MHDPCTVAFDITFSFEWLYRVFGIKQKAKKHWIVTIWHKDPEINGDEDSCGWISPPITEREAEAIAALAEEEYEFVVGEQFGIKYDDPYGLIYWSWASFCDRISGKKRKRFALSNGELNEVLSLSYNPSDNLRGTVFDVYRGPEIKRKEAFRRLIFLVYRCYKRYHRPWYRHPKWHVHHWRIQIYALLKLKRYLFSKCAYCNKGFRWGESPHGPFHGTGPLWFRSEKAWHSECTPQRCATSKGSN